MCQDNISLTITLLNYFCKADPWFPDVYDKFWSYYLKVAAEIEIKAEDVFFFLLSNIVKPVQM